MNEDTDLNRGPTGGPAHREIRESLGSYALGHLNEDEADAIRAHVEGCAECRSELAEISGLASLLSGVDADQLDVPPVPPSGLGEQIRQTIEAEADRRHEDEVTQARERRRARAASWRRMGVAAAAVVLVAALAGVGIGRVTAPEAPAIPRETIALEVVGDPEVVVDDAFVVPHKWGMELRFEAAGFEEGATYRATFVREDGTTTPAGEFLGTEATMLCNLQSAVLREDVRAVRVTDAAGRVVMRSSI